MSEQVFVDETPELIENSLKELRLRFENDKTARVDDEEYLLRYLRCAKFDIDKAETRMRKMDEFMRNCKELEGRQMTALQFKTFFECGMLVPVDATDNQGHIVVCAVYRLLDYEKTPADEVVAAMLYFFERLAVEHGKTVSGVGLSMIADCLDMGWAQFDSKVEQVFTDLMQSKLPMRIGQMAMVEQPFIMTAMLAIMKPFMSKKMRQRLQTYGTKFDKLRQVFPSRVVPQKYGGDVDLNDRSWLQAWIGAESDELELSAPRRKHINLGVKLDHDGRVLDANIGADSLARALNIHPNDFVLSVDGKAPKATGEVDASNDTVVVRVRRVVRDVFGKPLTSTAQCS